MSFFFKQKTAYEMRISDWSSDVCSSDLVSVPLGLLAGPFTLLCLLGFQNAVNMADGTNGLVIGLGLGWVALLLLHAPPELAVFLSPEERRVGEECVSTFRSRWCTEH